MKDLIEIRKLQGDDNGRFDTKVYTSNEQLINCVYACKGGPPSKFDSRVLLPLNETATVSDYIIQHLKGNENLLDLTKFIPENGQVVSYPDLDPPSNNSVEQPSVVIRLAPTINHDNIVTNEAIDRSVISMLDMLKPDRWDDYQIWVNLAILLKNIGNEIYYSVWLKLSKTSQKFVSDQEARRTWESAAKHKFTGKPLSKATLRSWAKQDNPIGYHRLVATSDDRRWMNGDLGLSRMAAELCKDTLRLDPGQKLWYSFDASIAKWRVVREATAKSVISDALRLCLYTTRADLASSVIEASSDDRARMENLMEKLNSTIKYVQDNRGVRNILSMGQDLFAEAGFSMKLDAQKNLLGVNNGVVDLRTGCLRKADPEDMVCREIDVNFDSDVDVSFISNMIGQIMAEDSEMISYLQKLLGYGLTGEVCEEIFVFFNAGGRNGKSVLLNAIEDLMRNSGFFIDGNMGLLVDRRVANMDAERAKIFGSRFLIFNELKPDDIISLDNFKALSGGDNLPAAAKYGAPFSIIPYHLPICATNSMPILPIVDIATAQRVVVIEFPVTFVQLESGEEPSRFRRQRDNDLKRKLADHKQALLTWLVRGATDWYRCGGLKQNAPDCVKRFTNSYLQDQDDIEEFLTQYYVRRDGKHEPTSQVLSLYNSTHDTQLKAGQISTKMAAKNIKKASGRIPEKQGTVMCFHGIQLKPIKTEHANLLEF